jgi:hypothetical protein
MSRLFVEGKPDSCLVRALGLTVREVREAVGRGEVANSLKNTTHRIGLIDEDPHAPHALPSYIRDLSILEEAHGIQIRFDGKRQNRVIVLRPDLENWLFQLFRQHDLIHELGKECTTAREWKKRINTADQLSRLPRLIQLLEQRESLAILYLKRQLVQP